MSDMQAMLVDSMGNDLTVVNAARVSFNSHSDLLNTKDEGLITFLAKHGHWSPFAHVMVQFRMKAPIFVARQLVKHQVGLTWNEVSRRYVSESPTFHTPSYWRQAAKDVKQGSSKEPIDDLHGAGLTHDYKEMCTDILKFYDSMIEYGICPEQARMILPQSMMTEWYWTGSLVAFARIVKQRTHSTAQLETQEVALLIKKALDEKETITHSWRALCL